MSYAQTGFLTLPLTSVAPITAGWFYDDTRSLHRAIDYGAPFGSDIVAAADGWAIGSCQLNPEKSLVFDGTHKVYGRFVFVQYDNAYSSIYAHMDSIALGSTSILPCDGSSQQAIQGTGNIAYGGVTYTHQRVLRGSVIGKVGMTGTKVAHLHFEVAPNVSGSYDTHVVGKLDPYAIMDVFTSYPPPTALCQNIDPVRVYLWTECSPVLPPGMSTSTWTHTWGGAASDSIASVATDSNGNVYAVGSTSSYGAGGSDVLLLKYDSSGNLLWSRIWGGPGTDNASGVAIDSVGNIYIVGSTTSFGAGWYDALILKFDSSGNLVWSRTWGGGSFDGAYDLAFDPNGNLDIAAESYSLGNRAVLLKLDPNGGYLGAYTWKGSATYDSGYSVDVDTSGNVVLAGISWDYNVSPNHNSILVLKFDASGNFLWHRNLVSGAEDEATGSKVVRFDKTGNILVAGHRAAICGTSNFAMCNFDAELIKLDPNGNQLWSSTWGGADYESLAGLAFDTNGNIIVSGSTNSFLNGSNSALLLKSDPSGHWLSSEVWGGNGAAGGAGLAMANDGGVLMGGYAPNASGGLQSVVGSSSNVLLTLGTDNGNVGTATFTLGLPAGSVGKPVGVIDVGGGNQDALILKAIVP